MIDIEMNIFQCQLLSHDTNSWEVMKWCRDGNAYVHVLTFNIRFSSFFFRHYYYYAFDV